MFLDLERAGCPKVGEKLITEAHNEEPDISSHLRSCHKKAPGDEEEGSIKEVVNIPEPGEETYISKLKQCQIPNYYLNHKCVSFGYHKQIIIKCIQV